jgi:hypothetical protein
MKVSSLRVTHLSKDGRTSLCGARPESGLQLDMSPGPPTCRRCLALSRNPMSRAKRRYRQFLQAREAWRNLTFREFLTNDFFREARRCLRPRP